MAIERLLNRNEHDGQRTAMLGFPRSHARPARRSVVFSESRSVSVANPATGDWTPPRGPGDTTNWDRAGGTHGAKMDLCPLFAPMPFEIAINGFLQTQVLSSAVECAEMATTSHSVTHPSQKQKRGIRSSVRPWPRQNN